ncbi:YiaA/YiaB family inner membrane protein, partial [Escherichia coli]|uniref:YiaA/YiaB family inner membrane protein n=1 Tax=Escherichia coli TaxID=562 RepID=UPI003075E5E3
MKTSKTVAKLLFVVGALVYLVGLWISCPLLSGKGYFLGVLMTATFGNYALMNPLMILVKIIKLRWIHILSYDQMVSRKINNQTTRCANSIFYTTL